MKATLCSLLSFLLCARDVVRVQADELNPTTNFKLLKDIHPGEGNSNSDAFVNLDDNRVVFVASDGGGEFGLEPWIAEGEPEDDEKIDVHLVKDILPGSNSSLIERFVVVDGKAFFLEKSKGGTGHDSIYETVTIGLWQTNGTEAGTRLLHEFSAWGYVTFTFEAISYNGDTYIAAGPALYKVSEDSDSLVLVHNLTASTLGQNHTNSSIHTLLTFQDRLYLSVWEQTGDNVLHGVEISETGHAIFSTDGSEDGLVLVKEDVSVRPTSVRRPIIDGVAYSKANGLGQTERDTTTERPVLNGSLYFVNQHYEVWRTDGTSDNTVAVTTQNEYGLTVLFPYTSVDDDKILFASFEQCCERMDLFTIDARHGIRPVNYTFPGGFVAPLDSKGPDVATSWRFLLEQGERSDQYGPVQLWTTDGTEENTRVILDLVNVSVSDFKVLNDNRVLVRTFNPPADTSGPYDSNSMSDIIWLVDGDRAEKIVEIAVETSYDRPQIPLPWATTGRAMAVLGETKFIFSGYGGEDAGLELLVAELPPPKGSSGFSSFRRRHYVWFSMMLVCMISWYG